ncbi:hypothetical protein FQN49_002481 [Arthroderma sp. PD_2]|nr:hypothetical protein FQN49_002481 [Arthroderma sp. PD_2]
MAKVQSAPRHSRGKHKSKQGDYKKVREAHKATGRTKADGSDNTKKALRTVRRKLDRLCAELNPSQQEFLKGMAASDAKTFFDWLEEEHYYTITAAKTVDSY